MFKLFDIKASNKSIEFCNIMNIEKLHNSNVTGKDTVIAIIDTGCNNHDLLKDKIICGKNFTREGSENDFTDYNGHGTHVAGIIAAEKNQYFRSISPGCKLLICKVLNCNGEGSLNSVIEAIKYAIGCKVDIINMSLGATQGTEKLHEVIKEAVKNNISVVCASGNQGDNDPNTDELAYPGIYEEVIEVGAMDVNYHVSTFSNSNNYIDVVAPGEYIMSTYLDNNFQSLSGTSMATPMISGVLALLLEKAKKEFKRRPSEKELYSLLIKNTKSLGLDRSLQGNGYIYF